MPEPNPFYAIRPAFTGGEISPDVASWVDIDKYQLALLQAENATIRPYGAVRKRPGFLFCTDLFSTITHAMLADVRMMRFNFTSELSYLLIFYEKGLKIYRDGKAVISSDIATPFTASELSSLRTVQSVDVMYICSGSHPVYKLSRYSESNWTLSEAEWTLPAYGDINPNEDLTVTPSATTGSITLSCGTGILSSAHVGDTMKIEQYVNGKTVSLSDMNHTSEMITSTIAVGKEWKVITHGTWTGTVVVQQSTDNGDTWRDLRTYTSKDDYNPTESGDVDEYSLMRLRVVLTSGTCNADLSAYPYTHTGYVKITAMTSSTTATATVIKALGGTEKTADWYWAAWSKVNGYPKSVAFFQDRLVLGGNTAYPQRIWMSRTGDYENFDIDKENGTVTDDSAVTADLLSRQAYTINHMDVGNDLLIFTEGNMWSVSGSETVTPSNITPRNQESYGTNDVVPIRIGSRIIYVQRRGSIVRDTGYTYDSDSYVGQDLTLLAKHLIRGHSIKDAAYAQEPDSTLYFVRNDGALLVLTYLIEQKVYAWSHWRTDGNILGVCTVHSGNNDILYAVVERDRTTLERLDVEHTGSNQQDYIMLDCADTWNFETAKKTITGNGSLRDTVVDVLADGYLYEGIKTNIYGDVTLPQAAKKVTMGLPYTMILEQPNWDAGNTDSGTVQGRKKAVKRAILRLTESYGGSIGPDENHQQEIIYDSERLELGQNVLYTGDIETNLAAGGWDKQGRTYIIHDKPYPFTLGSIIREATFGG